MSEYDKGKGSSLVWRMLSCVPSDAVFKKSSRCMKGNLYKIIDCNVGKKIGNVMGGIHLLIRIIFYQSLICVQSRHRRDLNSEGHCR